MRQAVLLAALFLAASAQAIPVDDYVSTLERVHGLIATNQLAAAKAEAATLKNARVEWSGGHFFADSALLDDIAAVNRADRQLLQRLELTIRELRGSGAVARTRPNPKLLEQVEAEQEVKELTRGGQITTTAPPDAPMLERVARSIARMFRWISEVLGDFIDWLAGFIPGRQPGEEEGATGGMRWIVIGTTIVIVLAIVLLAFGVVRRSRRGEKLEVAASEPMGSKRDEDPLSRGATEWERYAAQLAAGGRYREAIRAWYHAVLVTCYSAGVLHFRKGRTNWEYVATVPPSVPWRPELITLTRRFELEWYGHEQSTPDALDDCSARARRILESLRQRGAA